MRLALSALFAGTILASGREAKLLGTLRFGKGVLVSGSIGKGGSTRCLAQPQRAGTRCRAWRYDGCRPGEL